MVRSPQQQEWFVAPPSLVGKWLNGEPLSHSPPHLPQVGNAVLTILSLVSARASGDALQKERLFTGSEAFVGTRLFVLLLQHPKGLWAAQPLRGHHVGLCTPNTDNPTGVGAHAGVCVGVDEWMRCVRCAVRHAGCEERPSR
jgi:hypothetical protein